MNNLTQLVHHLNKNPLLIFDSTFEKLLESKDNPKYPPFNVITDKDQEGGRIEVALAGFKPEDISIEYNENTKYLTIKSSIKEEKVEDTENYHHRGISKKTFEKNFKLDSFEPIDAKFEEGLLVIEIKKSKDAVRKIEVSSKTLQLNE